MKKLVSAGIILIVIFLLIRGWWSSQLAPVSSGRETKTIIIAKGKGLNEIAKLLKKENLIKSELIFSLYVRQKGMTGKLSAGTFKISPSASAEEIVKILTRAPNEAWITLIEGLRIEEMAEKFNEQLTIDKGEFINIAKEGYMFPDTYLFPKDYGAEQIATRLRNTFNLKYSDDLKAKIKTLGLTETQGVILASIVEREARSDEVRRMVASILLKRFKIGMGLNADATVQYALGYQPSEKSWWKRHLTHDDLKVDSAYNTYLHLGLPPKPIANPSLSSLQAVANADPTTDYLYYYHDSKGNSYYAKTLEEHNQNVASNP